MKKYLFVFVMLFIALLVNGQNPYRFNLAINYSSHNQNLGALKNGAGIKIAEYYKPFYDLPIFAGGSFEIIKYESLKALYYPISLSVGYFGNQQKIIAPVVDLGMGYAFYSYDQEASGVKISESGGFYSTENIGLAFNKWRSTPYISIGLSQISIRQTTSGKSMGNSNSSRGLKNQLGFKIGFLIK